MLIRKKDCCCKGDDDTGGPPVLPSVPFWVECFPIILKNQFSSSFFGPSGENQSPRFWTHMRPPVQFPFPNAGNVPQAWANGQDYYWYDGFQGWVILPTSTIVEQGNDPNLPLGGPEQGNYFVSLPDDPNLDLMQFDELYTNPNASQFTSVSVFNSLQRFRYGEIQVGQTVMPHGAITGTNRGVDESLEPHNSFDIVDSTLGAGSLHLGAGLLMWSNPGQDGSSSDIAVSFSGGSRPSGVSFGWVQDNHYQRTGFGYHPTQNHAPTQILSTVVRTTPVKVCDYASGGSLNDTREVALSFSDNNVVLDTVDMGSKRFTGSETLNVNTSGLGFTQSTITNSVTFIASYGYTGISFPSASPPRWCGGTQDDSVGGSFDGNCTALDLIESYRIDSITVHDQIQNTGQPTTYACGTTFAANLVNSGTLGGVQYASVEAGLPKALQLQDCSKPRECGNSDSPDEGFLSGFNSTGAYLGTGTYSRSDFNGVDTDNPNVAARDGHVIATVEDLLAVGGIVSAADGSSATLFSHAHLASINGGE